MLLLHSKQESDESFADDDSEEDASGDGSDAESEEEGVLKAYSITLILSYTAHHAVT
jgi:hypothetical protein